MKVFIVITIAFIAGVYIYTFIKFKKRKLALKISSIDEFHDKYLNESNLSDQTKSEEQYNQLTQIDYITKEDFYQQIQEELYPKKDDNKKITPKKFIF